jgi:hypothetical protein
MWNFGCFLRSEISEESQLWTERLVTRETLDGVSESDTVLPTTRELIRMQGAE